MIGLVSTEELGLADSKGLSDCTGEEALGEVESPEV